MATEQPETSSPLRTILLVAGVALLSGVMITGAWEFSHERILTNERARLLASLTSVIDLPAGDQPNAAEITMSETQSGAPIEQLYAMSNGRALIAWVYVVSAPQGYNGPIELLVGIRPDATISAVRVLRHRETPGLGDAIEMEKSDWIQQFAEKSLGNPAVWALEVDGGSFDAITGATVTPRAVVAAIAAVLDYHAEHVDDLSAAWSNARGNSE